MSPWVRGNGLPPRLFATPASAVAAAAAGVTWLLWIGRHFGGVGLGIKESFPPACPKAWWQRVWSGLDFLHHLPLLFLNAARSGSWALRAACGVCWHCKSQLVEPRRHSQLLDIVSLLGQMGLLSDAPSHAALLEEAAGLGSTHLRQLLQTEDRPLHASFGGVVLDYSRQKITPDTLAKLEALYAEQGVASSMAAAQAGAMQNPTEERSVLHTALRASREQVIEDKDGHDVVPDVYAVLDRIKSFSEEIRSGARLGATGKPLTNVVVIGIGGSYLGPEFVCEALRFHEPSAQRSAGAGRTLRFLANVDPTDVYRATADLNPEETLVVVISKTFTTAETMLNASTVRCLFTHTHAHT